MPKRIINDSSVLGTYTYGYTPGLETRSGPTRTVNDDLIEGAGSRPGWPHKLGSKDVGGSFWLKQDRSYRPPTKIFVRGSSGLQTRTTYSGLVTAVPGTPAGLGVVSSPAAWSAEAYRKMKPTSPDFSAVNSIYELKDLPGMVRRRAERILSRDAASDWLNLQFGWRPLLNDIKNLIQTQQNLEKRIAQLLRDDGKPVRRRVTLVDSMTDPVVVEVTNRGQQARMNPSFVDRFYLKPTTCRDVSFVTDRVWASARFRYWLPRGPGGIVYKKKLIRALYGFDVSPSVIYNMIPWTWLIDWFANVGDILENLEAGVADRLAADYFYVMREVRSVCQTLVTTQMVDVVSGQPLNLTLPATREIVDKRRIRGHPFDPAINPNGLSGMQLSILGALGLSRL